MLMLWGVPRSRSTAFFRMMVERGDFAGVHEPFSRLAVFGRADIGGGALATVPEVIAGLRALAATRPVFVKETTDRRYPGVLADRRFLSEGTHTFLIRHPRETIGSYLGIRPGAAMYEIGFEAQYEMYLEIRRLSGREPLVVDAGDLMRRPAGTVEAYCAHVGIDFRPDALNWRPSDRPEWRDFGNWHADVAASSGLAETTRRADPGTERHPMFGEYLKHHLPFYEELYRRRLVVG